MNILLNNNIVVCKEPYRVASNGTRLLTNNEFVPAYTNKNTQEIEVETVPRYFGGVCVWLYENGLFSPTEDFEKELFERSKNDAISYIDSETSASILAGFDYEFAGEMLHFSYDTFDQQNFADTANACLMAMGGAEGLPTSIVWNSYTKDGTLKQITLDAHSFLRLYAEGALAHKAKCMEAGGAKKAQIKACTKAMEVITLMDEWGVPE